MDKHQSESSLEQKLKFFECQRCQACCKQPGYVYLQNGEAERIAGYLQMDLYEFTDKFCEVLNRRQLVLKKLKDEACIFLDKSGCRVHPVKPQQCLDFPVKWRTPRSFEYCQGLRKLEA